MRLAIVGSRDFPYPDQIRRYVQGLPEGTVVVTGGDDGSSGLTDEIAAEEARARGLEVVIIWPQGEVYGARRAPRERNRAIVQSCDALVAFWGPVISAGTSHVVSLAATAGKLQEVVRPRAMA